MEAALSARSHAEDEAYKLDVATTVVRETAAELALAVIHWPRPVYSDEAEILDRAAKALIQQMDELVNQFIDTACAANRRRVEEAELDGGGA